MPVGSVGSGGVDGPGATVKTASGVLACSVASRFGSGLEALDGKLQASIKIMNTIQNRRRLYISKDYNRRHRAKTFASVFIKNSLEDHKYLRDCFCLCSRCISVRLTQG